MVKALKKPKTVLYMQT